MANDIDKKKDDAPVSQTRALLEVARNGGGPSEAQRRSIREKIEAEIADAMREERAKEDSVPTAFAHLEAIAQWSTLKRALLTMLLFGVAFTIDAIAPRELSILGVYLVPIVIVAWCFPDPSSWMIETVCCFGICAIEEVNAPPYGSTTLLAVSVLFRGLFFAAVAIATHEVKRAHRILELRSERDPLTGLLNRRGFEKATRVELDRARRHRRPIALAFLDIDDFKRINDQKGHAAGDRILQLVGTTLMRGRKFDLVARIGGDEFVILMPETSERGAQVAVERIRRGFHASARSVGVRADFTAGAAAFSRAPRHVESLLAEADRLLFEGKRTRKGSVRTRVGNESQIDDPLALVLRAIH
jgi:diguanylate cyclase (GGDEF)-like protein